MKKIKTQITALNRGKIDSFVISRGDCKTDEQMVKTLAELVTYTWDDDETKVEITSKISRVVVSPFQTGTLNLEEQRDALKYWLEIGGNRDEAGTFGGKDLDTEKETWIPAFDIKEVKVLLIK
jgi:hypothetical protein